jgi:hypothetical protein
LDALAGLHETAAGLRQSGDLHEIPDVVKRLSCGFAPSRGSKTTSDTSEAAKMPTGKAVASQMVKYSSLLVYC